MTVTNALRNKLPGIQARMKYLKAHDDAKDKEPEKSAEPAPQGEDDLKDPAHSVNHIPIAQLERRLELIKNWR